MKYYFYPNTITYMFVLLFYFCLIAKYIQEKQQKSWLCTQFPLGNLSRLVLAHGHKYWYLLSPGTCVQGKLVCLSARLGWEICEPQYCACSQDQRTCCRCCLRLCRRLRLSLSSVAVAAANKRAVVVLHILFVHTQ